MSYLPYTLTCRRTSEICIWSSRQRTRAISFEDTKLDQDKYIIGFSLSLCDAVIQKHLFWHYSLSFQFKSMSEIWLSCLGSQTREPEKPSGFMFPSSVHWVIIQNMSDTNTWNNQTKLRIGCTGILSLKNVQHVWL